MIVTTLVSIYFQIAARRQYLFIAVGWSLFVFDLTVFSFALVSYTLEM